MSIAISAGLAFAAIAQVLDSVNPACVQPLAASEAIRFTCQGAGAEFVRGLICAVTAGVAFCSGLACFFWAAHLRSLQQMARIRQSHNGSRHKLLG